MAKLGEICTINMGQSPDSSTYNGNGNGLPFFQGNADFGEVYPVTRIWCSVPTKMAREGDILISVRAPIGALNIANCECCIGRGLAALTANKAICTQKFLWHMLSAKVDELNSKGTGSTFKAINKKVLAETEIPLPPLDEQRRIAAVLDKVSDLIAKRRQQLEKLDELVKARFVEMFGDPMENPNGYRQVKLSEVATYFNGLTYKPESVATSGTIVLRSCNIQNNQLDFSDIARVNMPIRDKLIVKENDILMCSRNGSPKLVGKVALIKRTQEPMSFGAFMMIIRSRFYRYLMTYFGMEVFRRQIRTGETTTINQITGKMLNDVVIPLPPQPLIEKFTAVAERVEKQMISVGNSLKRLTTLKKALIQAYFG